MNRLLRQDCFSVGLPFGMKIMSSALSISTGNDLLWVAKAIANSLGLPAEELENYRKWGMYLDDLSCCGEECATC